MSVSQGDAGTRRAKGGATAQDSSLEPIGSCTQWYYRENQVFALVGRLGQSPVRNKKDLSTDAATCM